jgi:hypothetical protein
VLLDPEDREIEDKIALLAVGWKRLGGRGFDLFGTGAKVG